MFTCSGSNSVSAARTQVHVRATKPGNVEEGVAQGLSLFSMEALFSLVGKSVLTLEKMLLPPDLNGKPGLRSVHDTTLPGQQCGCPLPFHQEFSLGFSPL